MKRIFSLLIFTLTLSYAFCQRVDLMPVADPLRADHYIWILDPEEDPQSHQIGIDKFDDRYRNEADSISFAEVSGTDSVLTKRDTIALLATKYDLSTIDLSNYLEIGDNVSQLVNDAGYITDISGSETIFSAWDKNAADDFSGAFSALTGKPTTLAGYGITDAFDPASPGTIGGTTPGAGNFTMLTASITSVSTTDVLTVGNTDGVMRSLSIELPNGSSATGIRFKKNTNQSWHFTNDVGTNLFSITNAGAVSTNGGSLTAGTGSFTTGNFSGLLTINRSEGNSTYTQHQIGGVNKWAAGYEDANSRYVIRDVAGGVYGLTIANSTGAAVFAGSATFNNIVDRGSTTDHLQVSGGTGNGSGRNILLYGGSHATLANYVRFRRGSSVDLEIDGSGNLLVSSLAAASSDEILTANSSGVINNSGVELADLNISDWNTAFGWGNHASAGYSTVQNLIDDGTGVRHDNTGSLIWEGIKLDDDDITMGDPIIDPSPSFIAAGPATNIDFDFVPKGNGTVQVPSGYESNVNEDNDLINLAYLDSKYSPGSGPFSVTWESVGTALNTDDAYYSLVNDMLTIQINANFFSNAVAQPVQVTIPFSVHSSSIGRVNGSYSYAVEGGSGITGEGLAYILTSGTPSLIRLSPGVQYTDLDDDDISITFTFRCNDCTP